MQLAKMKVGTTYLVNTWARWKDHSGHSQAYILISKEARTSQRVQMGSGLDTITVDGITYAHRSEPWAEPWQGEKHYLMGQVNPETGEFQNRDTQGYPVLRLIRTRDVRGEWDEAQEQVRAHVAERDRRIQKRQDEYAKAVSAASDLLGRINRAMENRPGFTEWGARVSTDSRRVSLDRSAAEAVATYLEELRAENNRLKDEAAWRSWNLGG